MINEIYRIYNDITEFIMENYQEDLQDAFEHFWEEERPEDFLQGIMLEMAEMNFEDWLVIDYRNPYGETFLDIYERYSDLPENDRTLINAMRQSRLSLYEVKGLKKGEGENTPDEILLEDLLRGNSYRLSSKVLSQLRPGEIFATRLIEFNGEVILGKCVYPFHSSVKSELLKYLDLQFRRYLKNNTPHGDMESFLKEESSIFNTLWLSLMVNPRN